jgi:hypothetical protein
MSSLGRQSQMLRHAHFYMKGGAPPFAAFSTKVCNADKATFPSLCLDVRFEFITTQPGSFFRCNLNPLSDLIE